MEKKGDKSTILSRTNSFSSITMEEKKQVGMYLGNQNIINSDIKAEYKSRSDCERTHSHMKRMFQFTVKWLQQRSKEFYMAFRFVSYQTIIMARLLKLEPDIQNFSQYI